MPPWPHFDADEVEAVASVLRSGKVNYWTGQEAREFEKEFAAYHQRKHGVAMMNGTVTLEAALAALGIGPGDEVIVPSRTFLATASCVVMRGATPVVAEVDRDSGNLTAETVQAVTTKRTKAVIPVHLGGWPCEMDAIMAWAKETDAFVIEDCAQAHGAAYRGRIVGSIGNMGSFSFCQDKIMTTGGEGGLLVLDDEAWWKSAWSLKDHGKSWDTVHAQHPPGYRWLHESWGSNWRMTEGQAAIGRIQLRKLKGWVEARTRNAATMEKALKGIAGIRVPRVPSHITHSWYKFYAYVEPENLRSGWDRDRIMLEVSARGVPTTVGSCSEIYREKAFTSTGLGPLERLPVAKDLGETSLMFQIHPTIPQLLMEQAAQAVAEVLRTASRS